MVKLTARLLGILAASSSSQAQRDGPRRGAFRDDPNRGIFNPFAQFQPSQAREQSSSSASFINTLRDNNRSRRPTRFQAPDLSKETFNPAAQASLLNLRRFRGNEFALRSMPKSMIVNAFALNAEASAENTRDRLFMQAFRARANRDGVPTKVYEAIIQKLVTGTTDLEQKMAGRSASEIRAEPGLRANFCPEEDCDIPLTLDGIWDYGCWCTFEPDGNPGIMDGRSLPVNKFDVACMNMKKCLRCAQWDGEQANPAYECDARVNRDYSALYSLNAAEDGLIADCSAQNPGDICGEHLCSCEVNLVADILNLLWDEEVYDADMLHSQGFSQAESCPQIAYGSQGPDRVCCGQYPDRQFVDGVIYQCCDDRTRYNSFTEECCLDGQGTVDETGEC